MRRLALAVLVVSALVGIAAARGNESVARVSAGAGISLRLPPGWHLARQGSRGTRGRPNQPVVIASFPVVFARRPCPCGRPNYRTCGAWCEETGIRDFSAAGALVYVWEFPMPRNPAALGPGYVSRPARFQVVEKNPRFASRLGRELRRQHRLAGHACVEGPGSLPSWWSGFVAAHRAFQVEVYLGPNAGPEVRAVVDALLDGLRITEPHPPPARDAARR